jgi:hypothetical protein
VQVSEGQSVLAGAQIGRSGNTGCSTQAHLHFGVYRLSASQTWVHTDPYGWAVTSATDPWSSHREGVPSSNLWKSGSAPQLYRESRSDINPKVSDTAAVGIAAVRYMTIDEKKDPNGEYVELKLDTRYSGGSQYDLSGFTLRNSDGSRVFTFPSGATITSETPLVVYSGSGTASSSKFFVGSSVPLWNNDSGCVSLYRPANDPRRMYAYRYRVGEAECS